jgi:hypothetical protein
LVVETVFLPFSPPSNRALASQLLVDLLFQLFFMFIWVNRGL